MSVEARSPGEPLVGQSLVTDCAGCGGEKSAPIATILTVCHRDLGVTIALCEECGRDVANAVGLMCIKDGSWSKLEPRKRKTDPNRPTDRKTRDRLRREAR